jgi:Protein of unknown function (DUF3244).
MRKNVFYALCLFFAFVTVQSVEGAPVLLKKKSINSTKIKTKSVVMLPVEADYSNGYLSLMCYYNVGVIAITIEDAAGNVVHIDNFDSAIETGTAIDLNNMEPGDYYLRVAYGEEVLTGMFEI